MMETRWVYVHLKASKYQGYSISCQVVFYICEYDKMAEIVE
jgi:hypothetical protein